MVLGARGGEAWSTSQTHCLLIKTVRVLALQKHRAALWENTAGNRPPLNAFTLNVENIHSPLPVKLTATTGGNLTHNIFQFGPVYSIALFISISRLNECSTNDLLLCTLLLQWSSGEQPLRTVLKQDVREAVEAILILHRP